MPYNKTNLRIGSLNCRGLSKEEKQFNLINDISKYNLDITALQETKIRGKDLIKSLHSYTLFSADCSNSYHGVGFIVAYDVDCKFKKYFKSSRTFNRLQKYTNKVHPLYIISAYAPTSQITKENPIQTDIFYQDLEDLINSVNKKELIICGDFNAKTGSANSYLPKHVGKYNSANYTNTNGEFLVDLIVRNNLYLCNTFFKHKLEHVNTWTSNFTPAHKRNPTRTQIDYIIAPLNFKSINTNDRAYNGIQTHSDHKLLIGIFELNNCTRRKNLPQTQKCGEQQYPPP